MQHELGFPLSGDLNVKHVVYSVLVFISVRVYD